MTLTSEQVWVAMREKLASFFRRRVGDEHVVDDLVAETFLRVHAGLGSIDDAERVGAWVFRVARNVLADHRRRAEGETLDAPEDVQTSSEPASNFNAEVNAWLENFLEADLRPEEREAIELADVRGLAQAEIAAKLGLSLTAAKSRIQRARARLRELVASCCHVEFDRHRNVIAYRKRAPGPCCERAALRPESC